MASASPGSAAGGVAGGPAVRVPLGPVRPATLDLLRVDAPVEPCRDFVVGAVVALTLATDAAGAAAGHEAADVAVQVHDADAVAHGRPADLASALHALLRNAVEHGRGPVHISVRAELDVVEIVVQDHGPGLSPGQVATLFQRGAGGPNSGAGVGLHVARALVQRQGGSLSLRRHVGGCEFVLTLPVARDSSALPSQRRHQRTRTRPGEDTARLHSSCSTARRPG